MNDNTDIPRSPVYTKPPVIEGETVKALTFLEAMQAIIDGKRITKQEWNNTDIFCELMDGFLMIHLKKEGEQGARYHRWEISEGDLIGEDYFVI